MKDKIKDYLIITAATAILSGAVFFFLIPSGVPLGSVTGLALMLSSFIPLKISVLVFILSGGLLAVGFIFLGREFGGKTVYATLLAPLMLAALERRFPETAPLMGDPFLDMLCAIFLIGVGVAMLLRCNASSGGLDIIAKVMHKFLHVELGKAMSLVGLAAAATSVFVYDGKTVALALLGTYLNGVVLDHFIFGLNPRKRVCILSQKEAEITSFILHSLHSGATIYEAIGAYDGCPRREIITIVNQNEYRLLMDFIAKTDKDAFITVYPVNEVLYKPKGRAA